MYISIIRLMRHRQPLKLKTFLTFYNIFQVLSCLYFIINVFRTGFQVDFLWKCYMTSFENRSHVKLLYFSYLLKGIELIETVCFVLRKKHEQMSFLHIYHHVSTFLFAYFGVTRVGSECPFIYLFTFIFFLFVSYIKQRSSLNNYIFFFWFQMAC